MSAASPPPLPPAMAVERTEREPELLPKHKIFLSHSGIQKPFVEQLCEDLESYNYYPFFDKRPECLPKGKKFPELIFKAAKQCLVAVVVLSEDFFTRSKWPMLELAAFVEEQKTREDLCILPVFLKLSIASLKEESELWLEKWQQWAKEDERVDTKAMQAAIRALKPVNALELKNYDGELSLRKAIVQAILKMIPQIKSDVSHVQGMERLCKEILTQFDGVPPTKAHDTKVLGVHSIGGTGKTALCMSLCNRLFSEFDGRVCHVELGTENIVNLQRKALRQLTGANEDFLNRHITTKEEGQACLKERMPRQRVFLALDNVSDSANSIEAARMFLEVQFHPSSRVLVTARSPMVLCGPDLGIRGSCSVVAPSVKKDEAVQIVLDQANAPSYSDLTTEQKEVLDRVLERCYFSNHFHPLALKLLAGQLGSNPLHWTASSLDLHRSTDEFHPMFSVIETSYSKLPSQRLKDIFLDVALYTPEDLRTVEKICRWLSDTRYDDEDFSGIKNNLGILRAKALVENWSSDGDLIRIHDLHRELAYREARLEVEGKNARFLFQRGAEQVRRLLKRVSEHIQRIGFVEGKFTTVGLGKCSNLELLTLRGCENLVELDLHGLESLLSLELSRCPLVENVNLSGLDGLSWLCVSLCKSLVQLDLGGSKSLRCLTLSNCEMLGELYLRDCKMLRSVTLSNCEKVGELDLRGGKMLRSLSVTHMESLASVDLSGSESLECLTLRFCRQLGHVDLRGVSRLSTFDEWDCPRLLEVEGFATLFCDDVVCLRIHRWQNVPDGVMEVVESSTSLETLGVWDSPMSRLPVLRSCQHIRELNLSTVDVLLLTSVENYYRELLSSSTSSPLNLPSSLEEIYISDCRNVTILEICSKLQGLKELRVLVLRRVRLAWDWELRKGKPPRSLKSETGGDSRMRYRRGMMKQEVIQEASSSTKLEGEQELAGSFGRGGSSWLRLMKHEGIQEASSSTKLEGGAEVSSQLEQEGIEEASSSTKVEGEQELAGSFGRGGSSWAEVNSQLFRLPIENCDRLRKLTISECPHLSLPLDTGRLTNLEYLRLLDCPKEGPEVTPEFAWLRSGTPPVLRKFVVRGLSWDHMRDEDRKSLILEPSSAIRGLLASGEDYVRDATLELIYIACWGNWRGPHVMGVDLVNTFADDLVAAILTLDLGKCDEIFSCHILCILSVMATSVVCRRTMIPMARKIVNEVSSRSDYRYGDDLARCLVYMADDPVMAAVLKEMDALGVLSRLSRSYSWNRDLGEYMDSLTQKLHHFST